MTCSASGRRRQPPRQCRWRTAARHSSRQPRAVSHGTNRGAATRESHPPAPSDRARDRPAAEPATPPDDRALPRLRARPSPATRRAEAAEPRPVSGSRSTAAWAPRLPRQPPRRRRRLRSLHSPRSNHAPTSFDIEFSLTARGGMRTTAKSCRINRHDSATDAPVRIRRARAAVSLDPRTRAESLPGRVTSTSVGAPPLASDASVRRMGCGDVCLLNDKGYRTIEGSRTPASHHLDSAATAYLLPDRSRALFWCASHFPPEVRSVNGMPHAGPCPLLPHRSSRITSVLRVAMEHLEDILCDVR